MKKRILTVALVVALLATCFAGTYAYLQDSKAQTNTFTTGNVLISLNEAKVEKDEATGNLVAKKDAEGKVERTTADQEYKLFPSMTVTKDPTITVKADSEDAWVAAKVTVSAEATDEKDLLDLIGIPGTNMINVNAVASGGLLAKTPAAKENWNGLALVHETEDCVIYQAPGTNTWTLYIFMKNVQKANAKTVLFDTLTIPAGWDNKEMALINGMNIDVQAFAVQVNGFANCYDAMTTAFDGEFNFS